MEYSSAKMTCVLKLNTQCEKCKEKMKQILQNLTGSYSITIDGEQGTVTVTGTVNPNSLMAVLEKYGRHGDLKCVKFEGKVRETRPYNHNHNHNYFGEHEYAPYGMLNPIFPPPFPYPQHHVYEPNPRFFPPPMPPLPRPPPPVGQFGAAPPFPPPLASFWAMPPPPTTRRFPRGLAPTEIEKLEKAHKHCTLM